MFAVSSQKQRFLELSHVSETHQLCTREMLIDETACEDTRIEAARTLATGEGKGEEYVSRTLRILLANSAESKIEPRL
jgi:hypothetical protein